MNGELIKAGWRSTSWHRLVLCFVVLGIVATMSAGCGVRSAPAVRKHLSQCQDRAHYVEKALPYILASDLMSLDDTYRDKLWRAYFNLAEAKKSCYGSHYVYGENYEQYNVELSPWTPELSQILAELCYRWALFVVNRADQDGEYVEKSYGAALSYLDIAVKEAPDNANYQKSDLFISLKLASVTTPGKRKLDILGNVEKRLPDLRKPDPEGGAYITRLLEQVRAN